MKRKLMLLLACLFVGIGLVTAQTQKVTGVVISEEDGQPVIGASVLVKGTQIGAITGVDGDFTLPNVPSSAKTLIISYIGMQTQEVTIKPHLRVIMKSDTQLVDEVVIVGYGTTKREAKTGSITSVTSDQIAEIPASSIDKMLSGKMAGVQITQSSGQPGSATSIRIRGTSSINAGNNPLYVVDGVAVMSGDDSDLTNTSNVIAMLNPNDIENITVLKDAAAASVYGSRAANGVILVTTKSGKEGKSRFTVRAKYGVSSLANDNNYGVMSGQELLSYQRQAIINAGRNPDDPTGGANYYRPYELLSRPQTNWMDHFTRLGQMQEYEVNMSGGTGKTKYYNSLSYHNNEGIFYGIDFNRVQARINVDHELNKYLKTGVRLNLGYMKSQDVPMGSLYYSNPAFAGLTILPWTPAYNADGTHYTQISENSNQNPRATADYDDQWDKTYRFSGNMYLEWKPIKQLTLKTTNAAEMAFKEGRRYWSNEAHNYDAGYPKLQTTETQYRLLTTSNTATYEDIFGKHSVRVLLGQEATHNTYWQQYQMSQDLNPDIPYHPSGNAEKFSIDYAQGTETMLSFFGIADYNYDSRYYLQLSGRYDGSSLFGSNSQWGLFYSVGASWNLHNEAFMEDYDWLDMFKLRFSYGINGNNNIKQYQQFGTYTSTAYNGTTGMRPSTPANPDLSWEKNASWNVGIDFRFLKRFSGSIDVYSRKTTDMLLDKAQSSTSGFNTALQNVGSMRNTGVEFQFDANIIDNNDWKWDAGFNISHNKSKILELAGDEMMSYSEDSRLRHIVGEKLFTFYLKDYYGVNPVNGEALWRTESGELSNDYNAARWIKAGSPEPTYTGGINTSVSWKGIALSVVGEFKGGNKIFIVENRYLQSDGNQMSMNQAKSLLNYWKKPGDTGCLPKPIAGNTTNSYSFSSTRFIEKGDYFRIKDITLSYTFPTQLIKKAGLGNAKVYASGLNLYTFHDVNFWDPERGIDGLGYGIYPVTKTFVIGLDLTF
ncbi:TonB-dependent receptor [uncultured Bacteroides sp.]|uniref:SusC/RagA family TonB-linked outer membrane protein n=1 Tax=uncultured Bacteroides sp. TaxID=162156 RepID=UPI0025DACACC|nr:TonB-dependent receptor [uncultured Bacteroides sp.]